MYFTQNFNLILLQMPLNHNAFMKQISFFTLITESSLKVNSVIGLCVKIEKHCL